MKRHKVQITNRARMLPYIDFDIISKNPKIFMGYSDTTTTHLFYYKAGISSIYGPTLRILFMSVIKEKIYSFCPMKMRQ